MRRFCLLIGGATLLAAPGPAAATPAIAVDPVPSPTAAVADSDAGGDARIVFEATAQLSIATMGDHSATGWGPQLLIGRRTGELSLLAYGGILGTEAVEMAYGPSSSGHTVRFGGGARFSFVTLQPDDELEIDMAFELDAERRMTRWAHGGALDQTAIMGGFILNMAIGPRDHARRAFHYGIRMGGANAPRDHGGLDFVTMFELGMHWSG